MATNPAILKFFAKYIEDQIGIIYAESNYFQLEHRLNDIVTLLNFKDFDDLFSKSQAGISGQLRDLLLDVATNNETSFFRDSAIFEAIVKNMVPEIMSRIPSTQTIHFWSAAGSTGQEACSVAMSMDQEARGKSGFPGFDIFVSDVSERVLKKSREGLYTQLEAQRGLPTKLLLEYFENEGDKGWRFKSRLRDKFRYRKINLLEPFPSNLGVFDVILCRNVLIYQSVENKVAVVEKILKVLAPHGYLVLGAAESMLGISNQLKQVQFGTAVAYQKI